MPGPNFDPGAPHLTPADFPSANAVGQPKVVDLGNGYTIVWPDPFGYPEKYEVIANRDLMAGSGGGVSAGTYYTQQQQNARDAAAIAEQQRQFNETMGYNKARFNTEVSGHDALGNPTLNAQLGLGNLDVSRGNLDVSRGRLGLDQQQALLEYYKYLANTAANPRNFVENFYFRRGAPVPDYAANFGTAAPAMAAANRIGAMAQAPSAQVGSPQQNLAMGGVQKTAQPQTQTPAAAQPYARTPEQQAAANASGSTGYASPYEGLSGFNTDGTLRLAPNDPDAQGLMAKYPGRYRIGYDQGGRILPEPIVGQGVLTGQTYTFNEKGPEGVVPANILPDFLKRRHGTMGPARGYAGGGLLGFDPYLDPGYVAPTPTQTPGSLDAYGTAVGYGPSGTAPDPNPYGSYTSYGGMTPAQRLSAPTQAPASGGVQDTISPPPPPMPSPTPPPAYTQNPAPTGFHWEYGRLAQNTMAPTPPQPPERQVVQQPGPTSTFVGSPQQNLAMGGVQKTATTGTPQGGPGGPPTGVGSPTTPPASGATPGPSAPTAMPREMSAPGTFGNLVGTSNIPGARPTFLPGEDQQGTLGALAAAGIVPPFITRALAQSRGIQSQGTNTPFPFRLPADVPLLSELQWNAMTPDEQQAYLSYASSYGVSPEEYVDAIRRFGPQGETAPWGPLFGTRFLYQRQ